MSPGTLTGGPSSWGPGRQCKGSGTAASACHLARGWHGDPAPGCLPRTPSPKATPRRSLTALGGSAHRSHRREAGTVKRTDFIYDETEKGQQRTRGAAIYAAPFIVLMIQVRYFWESSTYTPGPRGSPHLPGLPKEVMPLKVPSQIRGPPESP